MGKQEMYFLMFSAEVTWTSGRVEIFEKLMLCHPMNLGDWPNLAIN